MEFYHASPHPFKPGDMIEPRESICKDGEKVYLINRPCFHYTLETRMEAGMEFKLFLVACDSDPIWQGGWDEYISDKPVMVIEEVEPESAKLAGATCPCGHDYPPHGRCKCWGF